MNSLGGGRRDEEFRRDALRYVNGLYGFALALSRDRSVAEDLVQETYLRALAARRKATPDENLRGWLFTILRNVWRNEIRRRRPEVIEDTATLAAAWPTPEEGPEESLVSREAGGRLKAAIEGLPEPFREVVMLRCVEGFSYRDVADIVGCPAGTVMSRLSRARALLRRSVVSGNGQGGPG